MTRSIADSNNKEMADLIDLSKGKAMDMWSIGSILHKLIVSSQRYTEDLKLNRNLVIYDSYLFKDSDFALNDQEKES